jgi:hypothetical protein
MRWAMGHVMWESPGGRWRVYTTGTQDVFRWAAENAMYVSWEGAASGSGGYVAELEFNSEPLFVAAVTATGTVDVTVQLDMTRTGSEQATITAEITGVGGVKATDTVYVDADDVSEEIVFSAVAVDADDVVLVSVEPPDFTTSTTLWRVLATSYVQVDAA